MYPTADEIIFERLTSLGRLLRLSMVIHTSPDARHVTRWSLHATPDADVPDADTI